MLVLGLRLGEVLGLPWANVNLDAAGVDVSWQLQRVGKQLHHRNPTRVGRPTRSRCTAAGVRYITPHGMRRTCASLLAALDVHPRVAIRILRHSKIAVTMEIYTKVPDQAAREALRRLGEQFDS